MSGVLVALGAAVAKTAFKAWAGDNALADNVSDELTDLIAGKVSDARDRQKVANRFAAIAEIVGDRVAETMREEFRGLPEGEKNAAVIAVTETLARADLHDINAAGKRVVAASLDAATLQRVVRRHTGDATRYLSADGTAFYDLVLSQCCASIVEIADKLPTFQSDAFAMLLSNDRTILERIEEVLTRLPMPSQDAADGDQLEVDYRRVIAKDFDRLQLFGLDFAAQWYPLSVAYVNLTMSARRTNAGARSLAASSLSATAGDQTFEHWLHAYPRLLIQGRAGGGKTTILQWIAVRAALRDFAADAATYNEYVPFFLRLREYVVRALPRPDQFLDSAASMLAPEAGTWPSQRLREGKAFVLVDGIDEIPERQRPAVLTWIEQLTGAFPQARYVVTTRPGAIDPDALHWDGFVTADLEPMSPALVRVFVDRWHDAMRGFQQDNAALEQLTACQPDLLQKLEADRFLGELANTPLLAGLICALNQHLGGELPRRRGEIYAEALKMFHNRDRKRGITSDVALDLEATNHLLSDLALWMVRNARTEVSTGDPGEGAESLVTTETAQQILNQAALALPARPPNDANLYKHLLLRSGVLREPTAGHVDFVHRTFQEYLAANALIRSDSVNELVKNASDDQWREIVILAAGLGITRQVNELLRGLLRQSRFGKQQYSRRLLAVACLDEIRQAEPAVLRQVEAAIPELLPPRDMTQAEALSHAGDRLISHLVARWTDYPDGAYPAVVRAAALTGGPEALSLIALLASTTALPGRDDLKDSLAGELVRAWSYFDPESYGERVIAAIKLRNIRTTDGRILKGVHKAPTVESVALDGLRVGDIDPASLRDSQVREVIISYGEFDSLAQVIGTWPSVRRLTLNSCRELTDTSGLWRLGNLTVLEIIDCGKVSKQLTDGLTVVGMVIKLRSNSSLTEFARLNPQIETLRLSYSGGIIRPGSSPEAIIRRSGLQTESAQHAVRDMKVILSNDLSLPTASG